MKNILRYPAAIALLLWLIFSVWRINSERNSFVRGGLSRAVVGSHFDPRGFEIIRSIRLRRESESFKERLRRGPVADFSWPALGAMQISWIWLELLQGLHQSASYEGDYSWMFSKLYTVIEKSPAQEVNFVSGLAPFFIVIGKDGLGATVVMNELQKRDKENWRTWFWSGFHAMENLKMNRMAGDYFKRAAELPGSPFYTAALAARLTLGEKFHFESDRKDLLEKEFGGEFLEKIKKARPEWFGADL